MKLMQASSLRSALRIVTGLVTGFVAGLPVAVAAGDLLPVISVRSPLQNQTVGSYVTVSAMSDSPGVVGLQFSIDGQNLGSEITSGACRAIWDSTKTNDGLHTIQAAGRDQYGNVTLAQPVTVLVSNPPFPTPTPGPGPAPAPDPDPKPVPAPLPTPEPTETPTPVPLPAPSAPATLSITAPLANAVVSGDAVVIAARFPPGSQYLSYTLRERGTGMVRWSANGSNLASIAMSSALTADLSAVPPGFYELTVSSHRDGSVVMRTEINVSIASQPLVAGLAILFGR